MKPHLPIASGANEGEGRDRINIGRPPRYAGDAAGSEPDGEIMQIVSEGTESMYRHLVTVGIDCGMDELVFGMACPPLDREGLGRASCSFS